jgi:peptidoglycan/LPS O-acetylase OafA/YrhL
LLAVIFHAPYYGSAITFFFLAGMLLAHVYAAPSSGSGLEQGFAARQMSVLGDISYSVYLVHPFVLGAMNALLNRIHEPTMTAMVLYFAVCLGGAVVAGKIGYVLIEKPMLAFLNARLPRVSA